MKLFIFLFAICLTQLRLIAETISFELSDKRELRMFLTVAENTFLDDASCPLNVLLSSSARISSFSSPSSDEEHDDCEVVCENLNENVCCCAFYATSKGVDCERSKGFPGLFME